MFGYDIFLSDPPEFQELRRRRNEAKAAAFYAAAKPLRVGFSAAVESLRRWNKERQAVQELSVLDDRILKDIGLERRDIRGVARSFARGDLAKITAAEAAPAESASRPAFRPAPRPAAPRLAAIEGGRKRQPRPLEQPALEPRRAAVGCG